MNISNIKKHLAILTLAFAFIGAGPTPAFAQGSIENDPGYLAIDKALDLKTLKPEVNINLPKFLLKDALADLNGGKDDPFASTGLNVAELIQDIKLIRVVVLEGKKNSDAVAKGIANLRATLEKNWTPLVAVADGDDKVGIYAISDATGNTTAGLALVVHEKGGDAVIANVVGRISLGKIIQAASKFDKLPKDLLQKLSAAAETASGEKQKDSEKTKENPDKKTAN